jgi:hypothetical protein
LPASLFGGRVLDCRRSVNAAGFGFVVDDFAVRAEGLHGVNQSRVQGQSWENGFC